MSKRAARDQEFDLFIPRMNSLPLKDQRELMERPFFSLQKRKRLKPIEYTSPDGDVWVHVSANRSLNSAKHRRLIRAPFKVAASSAVGRVGLQRSVVGVAKTSAP